MREHGSKSECPSRQTPIADSTRMEVGARMKVLIGVDPHKASIALAVVDEVGELLEYASFPHNRAGLRALENAGRSGSPSVVGQWRTPLVSADTWPRGWQRPARRWWTCRPSSQRACGCSLPATPARTMGWTLSPPRWPPGATSGYPRLIPRLVRRYCASFPRGAKTWSPSVPERSTVCTDSCGTSCQVGYRGHSRPTEPPASCAAYAHRAPRPVSAVGWLRRSCVTSGHLSERSRISMGASKPRSRLPAPPSPRSSAWVPYWLPR